MTSKETRHLSAEQIAEFEAQKKAALLHGENIHKLAAKLIDVLTPSGITQNALWHMKNAESLPICLKSDPPYLIEIKK